MPPNPPKRYLTRDVKKYVELHDSVPYDPIEIESDEDDTQRRQHPRTRSTRGIQTEQPHTTQTEVRIKSAESRDETRLLPTVTKREPGAVTIADPMMTKKPPPFTGRYRACNTLDSNPRGPREQLILQKTSRHRTPAYDNSETHLVKRRKIDNGHGAGTSATSAITVEDSQNQEDSADELGLGSELQNGDVKQTDGQADRTSPDDEGEFTKGSAKQRKAEKDKMLASSPPAPSNLVPAGTPFRPPRYKARPRDSPDELQADHPPISKPTVPEEKPIKNLEALITGNPKTMSISRPRNPRPKQSNGKLTSFKLDEVIYRSLSEASICVAEVNRDTNEVSINSEGKMLVDDPMLKPRSISEIVSVLYGDGDSRLATLTFSRTESQEDKMHLKFHSAKELYDFVRLLGECSRSLRVIMKAENWMEAAFHKAKRDRAGRRTQWYDTVSAKNEKAASAQPVGNQPVQSSAEKHIRLVDRLDSPPHRRLTIISGQERSQPGLMDDSMRRSRKVSPECHPQEDPHKQMLQSRRVTRGQDNKQTSSETAHSEVHPSVKTSGRGGLGEPWRNDLVYPGPGKRSAIVPFEDLRRLNDDEFLNDNLISFFMQYLETYVEKHNPELYRDMYFFNTYFYEALTKNVKGRKGINYDAVSRWTKNINIFKRKFVVVPVNENFHWYLAIICNLSYFLPKAESDGDGEAKDQDSQAIGDSQYTEQQSEGNTPNPATEETQRSLAELSISDDEEKSGQNTPTGRLKKGPGRRKAIRRSLPKYDIDKPVIITLDSLGSARSATCSLLRQYIAAEAKNKQNLDIEPTELRGMTAKQIPTQSNFSDCGLYLCMYLEQFVAEPVQFVSRILQRQEEAQQWPRKIRSEDLRSRLRELILELHRRQENHKPTMELPRVGNIMIEKRKPTPEPSEVLEPKQPRTKQDIAEARLRFQSVASSRQAVGEDGHPKQVHEQEPTSKPRSALASSKNPGYEANKAEELKVDVGDDDDDPILTVMGRARPRDGTQPHQKNGRSLQADSHASSPDILASASPPLNHGVDSIPARCRDRGFAYSTPSELAASLREQNELREAKKQKRRRSSPDRHVRESSASTDFLTGVESYAVHDASPPPKGPQGKASPTVPDTPRRMIFTRVGPVDNIAGGGERHGGTKRRRYEGPEYAAWIAHDSDLEVPETQQLNLGKSRGRTGRRVETDEDNEMLLY